VPFGGWTQCLFLGGPLPDRPLPGMLKAGLSGFYRELEGTLACCFPAPRGRWRRESTQPESTSSGEPTAKRPESGEWRPDYHRPSISVVSPGPNYPARILKAGGPGAGIAERNPLELPGVNVTERNQLESLGLTVGG
jgi:hypothetical protein